ncbi:exported hypothetical protein [Elizabethkingia anophelis]|nr:hypothetical protein EAVVTKC53_02284 [Elizabethkingia anophelis]CAI9676690.1 hypothetical protein EAVVTKC53_00073 [Elizabethkingia anophelis]CDN76472.1 exported hypothetical protein [Elizabethkingia anophelis]CDN80329.1 exported hypothetical protein [Elizabethkingia anophelis]SPW26559.1 Uncharacterised protein [Elizabethkingia anophelis]
MCILIQKSIFVLKNYNIMKNFTKIILKFLCFSPLIVLAQAGNIGGNYSVQEKLFNINRPNLGDSEFIEAKGSPYLSKQFSTIIIDGLSNITEKIRYNIFKDEMEFMKDNQLYYMDKVLPLKIIFPELDITFELQNYNIDNKIQTGFLQPIGYSLNHKLTVYKKYNVGYTAAEPAPNSFYPDKSAEYFNKKPVYLLKYGDKFYNITKDQDILKVLPEQKTKISEIIKQNKLNFKTDQDYKKLIELL